MINILGFKKVSLMTRFIGEVRNFAHCTVTNKKKYAFTMAEVLVTLGIIGIVAAMTLPSVIGKYQKQVTISKLQKTYSVLNQALARSEVDHEDYKYWPIPSQNYPTKVYFAQYWAPYLNISHICKSYQDCGYSKLRAWNSRDGSNTTLGLYDNRDRISFYLNDGVFVMMRFPFTANNVFDIWIDINGAKPPNMLGYDMFIMNKAREGNLKGFVPYGYGKSYETINVNCRTAGSYCLAKIVADGWVIKEDYGW